MISIATPGLGIVFLMVEKPDWLGSIITLVVVLLVHVILAQIMVHSGQACVPSWKAGRTEEQTSGLYSRA